MVNDRTTTIIAVGLVALPPIVLAVFLFALGRVFANEDALLQFYPYAVHAGNALREASPVLFTGGIFGGFPLGATMTGGFFHPLYLLAAHVFDAISAYHILTVLYYTAGGGAMYAFLRRLGCTSRSAAFGAVTYLVSQPVLSFLALLPNVQSVWLLPGLFLFVHRLQDATRRNLNTLALALVLAGGWFGVAPQLVVYAALAAGCFAIFLDIRGDTESPYPTGFSLSRFPITIRYGIAGIGSLVSASPYLLFAAVFNALSARPDISFAEYHGTALPIGALLRYAMPSLAVPFVVPAQVIAVGFVPLVLAIFALCAWWRDRWVKFFSGLTAVALLAALQYSPLTLLLHYLPVFKYFRGPARLVFVAAFALAVLAAKSLTAIEQSERTERIRQWFRRSLVLWVLFAGLGAVCALLAAFGRKAILSSLWAYFDAHYYVKTSQLPLAHYHRVIERYLNDTFNTLSITSPQMLAVLLPTLGALGVGLVLLRRERGKLLGITLTLMIAIEGIASYLAAHPFIPRTILAKPAVVEVLEAHQEREAPFRVFSFLPLETRFRELDVPYPGDRVSQSRFLMEALAPNTNLFWGIPSLDGYDNLMAMPLARTLADLGSERATFGDTLATRGLNDKELLAAFYERLPRLGRLGVRYIIAAQLMQHPGLSLVATQEVTERRILLHIYEYAGARALVEFAPAVAFSEPSRSEREDTLPVFSGNTVTIACAPCAVEETLASAEDTLLLEAFDDGRVQARLVTDAPRWVIVRNVYLPGWRADIDGVQVPLYRADGLLQAVRVPAGTHELVLRFSYGEAIRTLLRR